MTNLIEVLKEQAAFGFTGKVNIQLASNGQFQGVIYQREGTIVEAQYGQTRGKKALFKLIFEDVDSREHFKFIVEPELVSDGFFSIKMSFEEVRNEAQSLYQKYVQVKKLKPAFNLKLVIDPEIIVSSEEITPEEFDVLSLLSEWCLVSDLYKYSKMMEFEVTNALIGLRKKRAIKVFQN